MKITLGNRNARIVGDRYTGMHITTSPTLSLRVVVMAIIFSIVAGLCGVDLEPMVGNATRAILQTFHLM